jgi:16S rRNA (adenine1518-N6/adenine1519-N6)-dimethyltransferase
MRHVPRRRFSQNFLIDEGVIADIVAAIGPRPKDAMVEIGPGLGALTRPLAAIVRPLHVIEIDRDIVERLRQDFAEGALAIHEGDVLEFDFATLPSDLRVIGNLPYHISTPILFRIAEYAGRLSDIHVMLQREVVDRMVAAPASSAYGRLSVMLQYRFQLEKVVDVPASAFEPAPKVESAVVRLMPAAKNAVRARDENLLAQVVMAGFAQRRKTLRNTLSCYLAREDFDALAINPSARAQELGVEEFVRITDYIADGHARV